VIVTQSTPRLVEGGEGGLKDGWNEQGGRPRLEGIFERKTLRSLPSNPRGIPVGTGKRGSKAKKKGQTKRGKPTSAIRKIHEVKNQKARPLPSPAKVAFRGILISFLS